MKKIFLLGDFHSFTIGNVKYLKEKTDFILLTICIDTNFKSQKQILVDSIKYIKGNGFIWEFIKKETPDVIAILAGDVLIETMQQFNKTKFEAEKLGAEMIVVKPFIQDNFVSVYPHHVFDEIKKLTGV